MDDPYRSDETGKASVLIVEIEVENHHARSGTTFSTRWGSLFEAHGSHEDAVVQMIERIEMHLKPKLPPMVRIEYRIKEEWRSV